MTPRKPRSPSYPAFDLPQAAEKAQRIYDQCGQADVNRDALSGVLGFSPTSGGAKQNIATLTQYGLLERRSQGELGISQLAVKLLYNESDEQKLAAAEEALRTPSVFNELTNKFGHQIPTEQVLIPTLTQASFNIGAAQIVAKAYVASASWVDGLREGDSQGSDYDSGPNDSKSQGEPRESGPGGRKSGGSLREWLRLPVGGQGELVILVPGEGGPDAADVESAITVLEALAKTLPRVDEVEGELLPREATHDLGDRGPRNRLEDMT